MTKKQDVFLEEAVLDDIAKDFDLLEMPLSRAVFKLVIFSAIVIAAIVTARIFFLGIVKNDFYQARAIANAGQTITVEAERGGIFDRFGNPLVKNQPVFRLNLILAELLKESQRRKTIQAIKDILNIDVEQMENLLNSVNLENSDSVALPVDLSEEEAKKIKNLNLNSLRVANSFEREYIEPQIFSHLTGYTGLANKEDLEKGFSLNDIAGKSGLEKYYDKELRGKDGKIIYYRNAKAEIIDNKFLNDAQPGYSIKTTIDSELQAFFYNQLKNKLSEAGSLNGVGIALNPKNGEVLSLISLPGFDSNNISDKILNSPGKPFFNRAISGLYAPGSTIKPLVALAALKENIVKPKDKIFSAGYLEIPNPYYPDQPSRFLDWKPHGWVDLYSALARSSNVYFYEIGGGFEEQKGLGIEKLKEYWQKFGFSEKTGIDLPGEANGFLPDPEQKKNNDLWRIGDTYNVSIGQGDLLTTPIEIIAYIAGIANNGKIYRPSIMKNIVDSNGDLIRQNEPQLIKDLSDLSAYIPEVQKGMADVVNKNYGTAYLLSDLPFKVAGKTGTAQIKQNTEINAFFIGYAPLDDPQIAILVLVEEAKEGSSNAVPIAKEVFKWYYENRL
ncbi:MAG: penicillin-binding protein 2 [Patescibacteria group bacterium]